MARALAFCVGLSPGPTNFSKGVDSGDERRNKHGQQHQHHDENGCEHRTLTFFASRIGFVWS